MSEASLQDVDDMTQLDRVEAKLDTVLEFVNMMTAGARNALGQPGMAGVAARAMMPAHLQAAVGVPLVNGVVHPDGA